MHNRNWVSTKYYVGLFQSGHENLAGIRSKLSTFIKLTPTYFFRVLDRIRPPNAFLKLFKRHARLTIASLLTLLYLTRILVFDIEEGLSDLRVEILPPMSWDYLMLSGFTWLFLGLWLSLTIRNKAMATIERLVEVRAINKIGNLQNLLDSIDEMSDVWSHRIAVITSMALALIFALFLSYGDNQSPSFVISWALIGLLGGYVAGLALGRMAWYGLLGVLYSARELKSMYSWDMLTMSLD